MTEFNPTDIGAIPLDEEDVSGTQPIERGFDPTQLGAIPLDNAVDSLSASPTASVNQFGLGVSRGIYETGQSFGSGIRMVGELTGIDFLSDTGTHFSESSKAQLDQLPLPAEGDIVQLWDKLQAGKGDAGDALNWFMYSLGNAGPSLASSVAGGAIGAAVGGPIGAIAGAGGVSYLLNSGEVYASLREQGYDRPGAAAIAGIPMAILDVVTPQRFLGKTIWSPSKAIAGGIVSKLGRVGKEALQSFGAEAVTEGAQEAIGAGAESLVTGKDFWTPETMARVLNAAAAGGLAGGALGAGGQTYTELTRPSMVQSLGDDTPTPPAGPEDIFAEEELQQQPTDVPPLPLIKPRENEDVVSPEPEPEPVDLLEIQQQEQEQIQNYGKPIDEPITSEELWTDPDVPIFKTPAGASRLMPTTDIFVDPAQVDIAGRVKEFNELYFGGLLPVEDSDYSAAGLEKQTGGQFSWSGGFFEDDRLKRARTSDPAADVRERTYYTERDRLEISDRYAMTPLQFDSTLLHELVHQEMTERARTENMQGLPAGIEVTSELSPQHLHDDSVAHGPIFNARVEELSKQANIPVTLHHDIPIDEQLFSAQAVRGMQKYQKRSNQVIADQIVKRLKDIPYSELKKAKSSWTAGTLYHTKYLWDLLKARKLTQRQQDLLLQKALDKHAPEDGKRRESFKTRVGMSLLQIEDMHSRLKPVVQLYGYEYNPKVAAQIEEVLQLTAPDGVRLLALPVESGYDYDIERENAQEFAAKIEANNSREAAERMGHIIAEKWLALLTPEQVRNVEQAYAAETRNVPDTELPTYGAWIFQNAARIPELERLSKSLKYHHAISGLEKSYDQWLNELGAQSRMRLVRPEPAPVPEPGKNDSSQIDHTQSLTDLFKDLGKNIENKGGFDGDEQALISSSLDKTSWFRRNWLTLIQFAESNKHIIPLQKYLAGVRSFWADKTFFTSTAMERYNEWNKLGKAQQDAATRFLLAQTIKSDELGRRLTLEEQTHLRHQYKLDEDAAHLVTKVDADFQEVLRQFQEQSLIEAQERAKQDGDEAGAQKLMAEIKEDYDRLLNRNYFPMSRFGRYTVVVTAKNSMKYAGKNFSKGDVVGRFQYQSRLERRQNMTEITGRFAGERFNIATGIIEESEYAFQGFPPSVITALESDLELTAEQRRNLRESMSRLAPGQGFMKHMLSRRGIAGFSEDGIRVYSDYMTHASNHYARLRHYRTLAGNINAVRDQVRQIIQAGGDYEKRRLVHQYMNEHYRYLMNPGNEAAGVRSFVFNWYFLGNVKQLLVNLTQVPLFTYGHLAATYGDVKTGTTLAQAYADVFRSLHNPTKLTEFESRMIQQGIQAGFIDESFATEMAAASHGDVLSRARGRSPLGQKLSKLTELGLFPFRWSEGINRRVSFLASLRLAQESGITDETQLFEAARKTVDTTQFEYSRWARMPIARGGGKLGSLAPVLLMFQSFTQGALYFYATQPGRGRAMVAMLLAAGLMGLPGAEDLTDIIDWLVTKLGEKFGWKNPHADARLWIRDAMTEMGLNADLVMHGGSRFTMGLYGLNMLTGLPVPALDLSSSISMGRVIPGIESVFSTTRSGSEKVEKSIEALGGVAGSLGMSIGRAAFSWESADIQRALPPVLRGFMQAIRAGASGGYTDRDGNVLVPLDPHDNEHNAELLTTLMFGTQPTRLRQQQEQNWAKTESRMYYMLRRELVMKDLAFAVLSRDPEARADSLKALRIYNNAAPPGLRISSTDMSRSLESRRKNRRLREMGMPPARRYVPLSRRYEPGFPRLD